MSSLLLHLIEIRSVFIEGIDWRLRQATLAFAAGVILVQRLGYLQGKSLARAYGAALGVAMLIFAVYHAVTFRLAVHPLVIFALNSLFFAILWWVGHTLSAACSVDSEEKEEAAAESGIVPRVRLGGLFRKKPAGEEEKIEDWTQRLTPRHPGRVIFYFSLFAIPAFGLGIYLFDDAHAASLIHLGIFLFIYLWCALALLFLSSFSQLRSYFEKRDVSLPELIGLTWISIGLVIATLVVTAAFFLPQPPSVPGTFIRESLLSTYKGMEDRFGVRTPDRGRDGGGNRRFDTQDAEEYFEERYADIDQLNDPFISELRRSGTEERYRKTIMMKAQANETIVEIFNGFVKIIFFVAALAALVVLYATLLTLWKGLSEGLAGLSSRKKWKLQKPRRRKRRKDETAPAPRAFNKYVNPFSGSYSMRDGNEVVRYLWEAMVAYCSDLGAPCPPESTPAEFVHSRPGALEGFEDSADFIADLFTFSEFSGEPISDTCFPGLRQFWTDLQRHASRAI